MYDCLDLFAEPTRTWFTHAFGRPADAQRGAWPAIRSGRNVLVVAPTGSGKTLAAFLSAIDALMASRVATRSEPQPSQSPKSQSPKSQSRRGKTHTGARGVSVLYVSPLKALAVDVARNLERPLSGIVAECERQGIAAPRISVATRSGDTSPKERRAIATHPPDILVTTPESLYLILTSKAKRILETVRTVIVDEVHALAGTKRGAHLALSMERLDTMLARPAQRIGLSATVNPPSEAARFLGGAQPVDIVNAAASPAMDLRVVEPLADMHDLSSVDAAARAGGVERLPAGATRISGVTPAMQRLAERKGLAVGGSGAAGDAADSAAGGRGADGGSASGGTAGGSIWPVVERSVLDAVLAHRTALVFVNSRGLAEKLTARLNDLAAESRGESAPRTSPEGREGFARHYDAVVGSTTMLVGSHDSGEAIAMAHHGSVSKDRRKQIEERLKSGRLRCVVATSSLELGIDMGSIDLVIQIAPPLSIASGLQRVGRADHRVGGVSHALFYPLTREQIIGTAAGIESMKAGAIEPLAMPRNPLDILAQQTVAAASMGDLAPDDWYALVRRAAPFADLPRETFDAVMGMLTGAYSSEEFSAFRPPLMWNHDANAIAARPGAQRLAVTSGGTIPDRGLYTVVLPEADAGQGPRRVGELDEEMVYESRVGDVITLGTSTWQIQEITRDRVIVTPASGRTARLPFWHGEGAGRDVGFGRAQGRFTRETAAGLVDAAADAARGSADGPRFDARIERRLRDDGLDDNAIGNLARLLAEQRAATGIVPSDRTIVVERCPDESGDWRVIIHSPLGRRVHEPWAMAITSRLRQRYGFDGQIYAADDGIVLRLPDGDGGIPIADLIRFDPDELQRIIETQVGQSVLFAARFRECAARSLYLPRTEPGKRVPLWQQRLRAAQLLEAAQRHRNFPLLLETARECLQDVYDLPALRELMVALHAGTVTVAEATTSTPSPFAEHLLFGFVGSVMYQYDVPQAERSAQLLSIDPDVLERLLGSADMAALLDPQAVAEVEAQLASRTFWNDLDPGDVMGIAARYAKTHGPFTADQLIADTGLAADDAVHALDRMAADGELLSGTFDAAHPDERQWLHREVFRRIRARSLAKARDAVKPVDQDVYQAFLLNRQGAGPVGGERFHGADGLLRVIEQLEGVALPAQTWERAVFPARVADYAPAMLDELLTDGSVVWTGGSPGDSGAKASESGRIVFHPADSPLFDADEGNADAGNAADGEFGRTLPEAILAVLASGGAYHASQLEAMTRSHWQCDADDELIDPATGEIMPRVWSRQQFEDALWSLVWQGKVTNSSLAPVRALEAGRRTVHAPVRASRRRVRVAMRLPATLGGLWSSVAGIVAGAAETADGDAMAAASTPERLLLDRVDLLLDRYGIIAAPLIGKDDVPGGFSALYPVLRRMEEHGTLVRGMFVRGFGAAQFAQPATVDALRDAASDRGASAVALDADDPAQLTGAAIAWPAPRMAAAGASAKPMKPTRRAGTIIVLVHGRPALLAAPSSRRLLAFGDDDDILQQAATELAYALGRRAALGASGSVTFSELNGESLAARTPITGILHAAGFTPCPQGMKLYR
ncbi:DEAD/DEAH box helicase [Bifidobacterium sp. DSM 109958]|uniref:DEAD/DEAH box helicase n=1 Tax=Bifidobacterium moraviense TaxID=2675323 RepID=A0A7Y0F3H5_9BIFI|nr:DEAD/DEAH box helicase [Bifidobacterium sp. DSM 109958]NMN00362.1 DEAD/DEAH box helicase [Bifidobacterium sp. DSM 109958]